MLKTMDIQGAEEFDRQLSTRIDAAIQRMGLIEAVVEGRLPRRELASAARRYYAEVRTFVDLKLPERMRLCPPDAIHARQFLARIYVEEHGEFVPGQDHPALWARFCGALGLAERELEAEVRAYAPRFHYLREREPSREHLVTELATMSAWESVVPRLAGLHYTALRETYGIPEEALEFFRVHRQADAGHARAAMKVLGTYADTPTLRELALQAATETLELGGYFV